MSLRRWYERKLQSLREQLRELDHEEQIGEILVEGGHLSQSDLDEALSIQRNAGEEKLLGEILVERGFLDRDTIQNAIEDQS